MRKKVDLLTDDIGHLIKSLSIPAFFGIVINLLYGFIDGIVIGDGIGQNALGGVTVIFPLTLIIISFASLIGEGLGSYVAREIVVNKTHVIKAIQTGFALMTWIIIVIISMSFVFIDPLLRLLGGVDQVFEFAKTYYLSLLIGLPFMAWSLVYFHMLNAQGEIKVVMKAMMISSVINIVLDILFVYAFTWGVYGAGIATAIAQIYWFSHMHIHANKGQMLTLKMPVKFRVDLRYAKAIIVVGLSAFIRQVGVSISLILINTMASSYDVIYLTSFGATQRILRLIISPIAAISTAFKPIVGQNFGKGHYERVQNTIRYSVRTSLLVGCVLFLIILVVRQPLGLLFGISHAEISIFEKVLMLTCALLPIYGVQHLAVAYFIALGMAKEAVYLNLQKQVIILMPLVFILPKLFGVYGLFMALPLSDLLSIGIAFIMMKRSIHRLIIKEVPS
ncbi:MATE family efflux transporter [Acidaminobacter sp. JC074]|uniref:MATE family efflux transporter n=1 Tax=Acidaminobacter sp. JC074 TaxID=2530199 RepID=UPI001F0E82DC|nr:MATE family efflux transporter [Acidaminobacter sp. JC074]